MSTPHFKDYLAGAEHFYEKEWVALPDHNPDPDGGALGELQSFNTVRETDALAALERALREGLEIAAQKADAFAKTWGATPAGECARIIAGAIRGMGKEG